MISVNDRLSGALRAATLVLALVLVTGRPAPAADSGQYNHQAAQEMVRGYLLFQSGDNDKALEHIERARKLDKESTTLKLLYAEILYEMDRFEEVIDLLEPLAGDGDDESEIGDAKELILLANSLEAEGRIDEAIMQMKRVMHLQPWNEWQRRRLLEMLKDEERYHELISLYKPIITPNSRHYALDLFQLGALYLKIGGHDPAREYLEKAVEADSTLYDAFRLLAGLAENSRDWGDALEYYLKFLELRPDQAEQVFGRVLTVARRTFLAQENDSAGQQSAQVDSSTWRSFIGTLEGRIEDGESVSVPLLHVMAIGYETLEEVDRAVETNESILEADPDNEFARRSLLRLLFDRQEYARMLEIYQGLLDPESVNYARDLFQMGALHLKLEHYDRAREYLDTAVQADPDLADAHRLLAHVEEIESNYGKAMDHYSALVRLDASALRESLGSLERLARETGQRDDLISLLEQTAEEGDTTVWLKEQLGRMYYQGGSHGEAREILFPLAESGRMSENGWYVTGFVYMHFEMHEQALEAFERVRSERPQFIPVYLTISRIHTMRGDNDTALEVLEQGLEAAPENDPDSRKELMFSIANVLHEKGKYGRMESILRDVLEMDPEFAPALNYLGYFYAERGERLEEARELVGKALEKEPDNGHYQDSMGWVLFKMGRLEEALDYIKNSLASLGGHPEVLEHLGDIYLALGEHEQAREAWNRSLELDGENHSLVQKLRDLESDGAGKGGKK